MQTEGATTTRARTTIETDSYPGWSSISCGMETVDSGVTDNNYVPPWVKAGSSITPITGSTRNFPCIFQAIKEQNSNIKTTFYFDKMEFNYLINANSPKKYIDDEEQCKNEAFPEPIKACDKQLVDKLLKIIDTGNCPNIQGGSCPNEFNYLMLGALDTIGHYSGWCNEQYIDYIKVIDSYIGQIKKKLEEKNLLSSTYIILTSDHGGRDGQQSHGEQIDSNIFIPFLIVGPDIKKGYNIDGVHNMDTSPTILKMLGLKQTIVQRRIWRGEVIEHAFLNTPNKNNKIKFFVASGGVRLDKLITGLICLLLLFLM